MSSVVSFPGNTVPEILHASVHSSGVLQHGSRNEVWLCPAFTGSGSAMLYVKPALSVQQMVAELVVAQAGLALGACCPQPYLVTVAPHHLGRPRGPSLLAYGSLQVGPNGLARPVRRQDLMLEMLRKAKQDDAVAVLDEWVGNAVRGSADLLFDPEGAVWIIDHEDALAPGLSADAAVTNWIADRLLASLDNRQREAFLAKLNARAVPALRARVNRPPPELQDVTDGVEIYGRLVQLLALRTAQLAALLRHRVHPDQPELPLAGTDETDGTAQL